MNTLKKPKRHEEKPTWFHHGQELSSQARLAGEILKAILVDREHVTKFGW